MDYRSLATDEIRVVRLLPSSDIDAQLRCEIGYQSQLSNYSALFYVWGKTSPPSEIFVGQGQYILYITPNLDTALRRLRDAHEVIPLWIDSLCINQEDDDEKRDQVGKMNLIYAKAETVYVWLGEEKEDSELAMQLVNRVETTSAGDMETLMTESSLDPSWANLRPLGILLCDAIHSNRPFSGGFTKLVQQNPWMHTLIYPLLGASRRIQSMRSTRKKLPILECLLCLRNRNATDPRDKVYAATQLAKVSNFDVAYDKPLSAVYVDIVKFTIKREGNLDVLSACKIRADSQYISHHMSGIQAVKVLREDLKKIHSNNALMNNIFGVINLLKRARKSSDSEQAPGRADQDRHTIGLRNEHRKATKEFHGLEDELKETIDRLLPSWVPDWTTTTWPENAYLFLEMTGGESKCHYRASKDSTPAVQFTKNKVSMLLQGVRIDTIKAIHSKVATPEPEESSSKKSSSWLDTVKAMYSSIAPKWTKSSLGEWGSSSHTTNAKDPRRTAGTTKSLWEEWNFWDQGDQPRDIYGDQTQQQTAFLCSVVLGRNEGGGKANYNSPVNFADSLRNLFIHHDENRKRRFHRRHAIFVHLCHQYFYFSTTNRGYMGRVFPQAQPGDIVVVFLGARVPHVLRRYPETDAYHLVGECYIHGVMEGEVMEELRQGQRHQEKFTLM